MPLHRDRFRRIWHLRMYALSETRLLLRLGVFMRLSYGTTHRSVLCITVFQRFACTQAFLVTAPCLRRTFLKPSRLCFREYGALACIRHKGLTNFVRAHLWPLGRKTYAADSFVYSIFVE